jgi:hypothetical protein
VAVDKARFRLDKARFRLKESMILEVEEEDATSVLIDGTSGAICSSNAAAGLLLRELRSGTTQSHLVEVLARAYGLRPADAAKDVSSFLQQLSSFGFIEAS